MKYDPWFRNRLIRDAMYQAKLERMREDPTVYLLGEGSEIKVHFDCPQIEKEFPERVLTMPISEDANTNFAVGMALTGLTPIIDVISSDFLYRTMDAICNTAAKLAWTHGGHTILIHAEFIHGGPTTGQRIESLFTHIPGLNVVFPSNPEDAYVLTRAALDKKEVTLIFEDRMIEDATTKNILPPEKWAEAYSNDPNVFGKAAIKKTGRRLTVVSYGIMARRLEELLADVDCDLIDLRSLYPLDVSPVVNSIFNGSGRLLVVEPDVVGGGIGAELVASVSERLGNFRVRRLGAPRATIPVNNALIHRMLPSNEEILAAVKELSS